MSTFIPKTEAGGAASKELKAAAVKTLHVQLDPELHRRMRQACLEEDKTLRAFVENALSEYLDKK